MEKKNFTKADLKVGYVVKTRARGLYMVTRNHNDELIMDGENGWMPLHEYNDDLTDSPRTSFFGIEANSNYDITEVYGYSMVDGRTLKIETIHRKLLWKREEKPTRMTHAEIEAALGFKIAIVGEEDK